MEVSVKGQEIAELQSMPMLRLATVSHGNPASPEVREVTKWSVLRMVDLAKAVLFVLLGVLTSAVNAAGTAAGTPISNVASVSYSILGVAQPVAVSNSAQFRVDRRVNLTVAEAGGIPTSVAPGASAQVLTFTVTNTSNAVHDFRLIVSQDATSTTTAFAGTDNFDVTAPQAFVDANGNGLYDAAIDTASFIDELPPDTSITTFIVATIPGTTVGGDIAGLTLTAVAAQSTDGTGDYLPTPGVLAADAIDTNTGVGDIATFTDTLFADIVGDTDAARDGRHSDDDEYDVTQATVTFTKTQLVLGPGTPVPGATIQYTLTVDIAGSGTLTGVRVDDLIPAGTTYVSGSLNLNAVTLTDLADADSGRFINVPLPGGQIEVVLGSVVAPVTHIVIFRVTIN